MGLSGGKCVSSVRLDGKTAVVTGANTGIGKITALDFYQRGAKVIMACRSLDKAEAAADDIRKQCEGREHTGELSVVRLDLGSLASVRECAQKLRETEESVDLLINNAGIMACPQGKTEDGFETQFGTNHLGHFLFTLLLMPKILKSGGARIVNVSSRAHTSGTIEFDDLNWEKRSYSPLKAYSQSKLANVLFTKELARRIEAKGIDNVKAYSLHPGVVKTELGRYIPQSFFWGAQYIFKAVSFFIKTPEQGAQTTIYCAVDEKVAKDNGLYYSDCAVKAPARQAENEECAKKLWEASLKMVGLPEDFDPFKT